MRNPGLAKHARRGAAQVLREWQLTGEISVRICGRAGEGLKGAEMLRLRTAVRSANRRAALRMTKVRAALRVTKIGAALRMTSLLSISLMSLVVNAGATTYYVSSSSGSDGNSGTSAFDAAKILEICGRVAC